MTIKESRKQKVTAAVMVPALIISILGIMLFIASNGSKGAAVLYFSGSYVLTVGILLAVFGGLFALKGKSIFAVFALLTLIAAVTVPSLMSGWRVNIFNLLVYPYSFVLMIFIILYAIADDSERSSD